MQQNLKYDYWQFFDRKIRAIARDADYILDVGGGRPFQKYLARYKDLFHGKRFETLDTDESTNPTHVGDAHNLPLDDASIDAVISKSVFEHLYDPKKAAEEMHRVIKPGGQAIVYTHFIYPYHAAPGHYEDYMRFTEPGIRYLFRDFFHIEIKKHGGYFTALFFFIPGAYKLRFLLDPIAYWLDKLFRTEKRSTTAGYFVYLRK